MRKTTVTWMAAAACVILACSQSASAVTFDGMVVNDGTYRPTGSDGRYERLFVIDGTDPVNGAILGIANSAGYTFNNPAIFPGLALGLGGRNLTLLSTGTYGSTSFVSDIYFHDGASTLVLSVPQTTIPGPAATLSGLLGDYLVTVSNFTWASSTLDRVNFSATSPGAGNDNIGHLTVNVQAVPEPGSIALVALAGTGALARLRGRRRQAR